MASSYTATDAQAYEHLMGRWSGRLAEQLIAFAGIETGERVIDVGCGTGSMALALAARAEPAAIVGIDIARPYTAYASTRSRDPRLTFVTGDAVAMDLPAVLHFCASQPKRAGAKTPREESRRHRDLNIEFANSLRHLGSLCPSEPSRLGRQKSERFRSGRT